ncbi:MAG: Holliday junction branch migration protein RuvA [Ruminococcus flavefaciens]|nr:Holliday junction branch migration protein RuvA [Ruminococcus flavefaciens]MCM1229425.1 Holliday junction branch migration protein RuvA [Ruminococcus flavefaciens]
MIYSLKGKLLTKEMNLAVVECGGVGYACKTSYNTVSRLGETGSDVMLYTHLYIKENMVELFGFATLQELNCFRLLISVSGVGPKAATSILSDMTPEQFAFTVASGDNKAFTRTKGIGAKTAQRIVLELKDKISSESLDMTDSGYTGGSAVADSSSVGEAMEALMVLGYSQGEIAPILRKLDSGLDTQGLIKETLRYMASRK